jgi:hypothetical protein
MKKQLILALCMCYGITAMAQEGRNERITMGMNSLSYTVKEQKSTLSKVFDVLLTGEVTTNQEKYQDAVRAAVVKGLSQAHRLSVIDGQLSAEEASRPNSCYVDATVSNISTTSKTETEYIDKEKKRTRTKTYYKALIGLILHIKDAKSDEIVASPTFNIKEIDLSWMETQDGAMLKALERLSYYVTRYCNRWLPLRANVVEGARVKKDKQKEVYIDLGEREGAYEGLHMGVYTVKTVAGKEAKKQIGRLKIEEVQGDDISLCKVQSGSKDIKAALEAGETLVIQTTD